MGMEQATRQALDEMLAATHDWFDRQLARDDLADITARSTLQVGVFDDIVLDYQPGRSSVDIDLRFGFDSAERPRPTLRAAAVHQQIAPALAAAVHARLATLGASPLIDYRFTFRAEIATLDGLLRPTLVDHLDKAKRAHLLANIAAYIDRELAHGAQPTDELDTFFLSRHLLDAGLFPALDANWTIAQFQRIEERNKSQPEALAQHRSHIIRRGVDWVENVFLPRYFSVQRSPYSGNIYTQKPGATLAPPEPGTGQANQVELLLFVAVMVLRHEPGYGKPAGRQFLELASLLGERRAGRMIREGSGSYGPQVSRLDTAQMSLSANDVFAQVDIVIREENADAYGQALRGLIRLLELGFPKGYKIKLKSAHKHFLPLKGLARTDTHRFFANALAYAELHPLLAGYARTAMAEFELYADVEDQRSCMPGSYAVFGLALHSPQHFALLEHYMGQVDEEHQSVQDRITAALVQQYGVSLTMLPTLLACLLRCTDELKLKAAPAFEDEALLAGLAALCRERPAHEMAKVLYAIWGPSEKLAVLARKAQGRRQQLLQTLLAAA